MKNLMAGEILQTQVGDVLKIIKKSDCTQTIYNIIFPFIDFLFFFKFACMVLLCDTDLLVQLCGVSQWLLQDLFFIQGFTNPA